jgi:hypothetical protein
MPTQSPMDRARSTEYFGQGQSGYTAGRVEDDHALHIEARNVSYPDGRDEHPLQLGADERFAGTGGAPWVPEEPEALDEPAPDDEQKGT